MKIEESKVLDKIFWPANKRNFLGTLTHSLASEDMTEMMEISTSRTDSQLQVFYSVAPLFGQEQTKVYLVKMIFEKNGSELTLNKDKTSPEISTPEEIDATLNSIQNNIIKMNNTKPQFFPTGVEASPKSKLSL